MPGQVLALGGGAQPFEPLLLELAGVTRPRVCFVPTAKAHEPELVEQFYDAFRPRDCVPSHLELFGVPERPAALVAAQDVVYVSGGNTANLLALWRVHGVDRALRAVWERGGVLAGWSAGANCWFEDSGTDSYGPELRPLGNGLGLLPGSFCPHYDGEPERRPTYTRLIGDGTLPPGYAADDDVGLLFRGAELVEVISHRPGARGWRVDAEGEEPLEPRLL